MSTFSVSGQDVLVVGMERSGVAAVELLAGMGAKVTATDIKPLADLPRAMAALERLGVGFEPQAETAFEGRDRIVVSPGVPVDLPPLAKARDQGVEVLGEVELASRYLRGPVLGITGSNGKTTTTALAGHLLQQAGIACQVGGNIGTPLCAMVGTSRDDQWNVLELSSFQLETIHSFRARIAVCLNVTPDHLDRHSTMERYAEAKGRLFESQQADDFAVLNADDEWCVRYASLTKGQTLWFSLTRPVTPGIWLEDDRLRMDDVDILGAREIPIRGRHNVENTMAAIAACRLAGASGEALAAGVRSFRAVEHRLEFVRTAAGVDYYNDSKATNVDASLKALDSFEGGLWVILGGKDKGSDYRPLRGPLAAKAKAALLIGAAAPLIAEQLGDVVPVRRCGELGAAVEVAAKEAAPGDTVLLAPACASFDQFQSYEHRGRVFKDLVLALPDGR